jgi:D-proline reductase (dithiol) PrdB
MIESWMAREPAREIPWTPLPRPLAESRLAVISSAGLALDGDRPFDQQGERDNPWWGDPGFRVIPRDATAADLTCYHLHFDPRPLQQDLNCVMPLQRMAELEAAGVIGALADSNYSIMGYLPRPEQMLEQSVPRIVERLRQERVDAVLLVPV